LLRVATCMTCRARSTMPRRVIGNATASLTTYLQPNAPSLPAPKSRQGDCGMDAKQTWNRPRMCEACLDCVEVERLSIKRISDYLLDHHFGKRHLCDRHIESLKKALADRKASPFR
jgi:hypothetical protein